ncbi:hypothetical protein DdX_16844 [Ditylenchus destructor]|uniref:Uncharacterized protein n=1 Tax=Ditylenchus destructor TaxID=166010 RepID=A0AAD4MPR3_9BILA|nr:hypothetical protein DdX_16844 [Ditylenchus destructor]
MVWKFKESEVLTRQKRMRAYVSHFNWTHISGGHQRNVNSCTFCLLCVYPHFLSLQCSPEYARNQTGVNLFRHIFSKTSEFKEIFSPRAGLIGRPAKSSTRDSKMSKAETLGQRGHKDPRIAGTGLKGSRTPRENQWRVCRSGCAQGG